MEPTAVRRSRPRSSAAARRRSDPPVKPAGTLELRLLRYLLRSVGDPPLTVALWDGQEIAHPRAVGRIRVRERRVLWRLLLDPVFQFGEAYSDGAIEIEGDLAELLCLLYRALEQAADAGKFRGGVSKWLPRGGRGHRARAADNVHHHYDLGNDFYKLWLDEELLYTCAYYPRPDATLEEAQRAKMEHVCRKLQLRPGESVVEAGCGWGALACYMAREYGVRVRAYNLSREQVAYARERARRERLDDRVEFVRDDWRAIDGRYDVFVSVGMLEHVGRKNHRELGQVIDRCLLPEGRGLLHSIGQIQADPLDAWIERRIFPGAYPPGLSEMTQMLEPFNLATLDLENLRLHYARTLADWLRRFEAASARIEQMFDARFVRMWRLYLAGSQASFETGGLHLFQLLFARAANNRVPWTREHQYVAVEE
jgi:cyclopropane-fatty-acyl-phospholipid synthase